MVREPAAEVQWRSTFPLDLKINDFLFLLTSWNSISDAGQAFAMHLVSSPIQDP